MRRLGKRDLGRGWQAWLDMFLERRRKQRLLAAASAAARHGGPPLPPAAALLGCMLLLYMDEGMALALIPI